MARAKPNLTLVPAPVLSAVERDLADLPKRPGTGALEATARRLAELLDDPESPATAVVAGAKTLADVMAQLRGARARVVGEGDGVDQLKRRRGAAT